MYNPRFEKETFKKEVKHNVKTLYRKTIEEATPQQLFQAVSYAVKEVIIDDWIATQNQFKKDDPKTVYYMSMEFLMGRALGNNLINMTAYKEVKAALDEMGIDLNAIEDEEPDPALGNGGLGRLAACFLDSLATLGYAAYGCGIRYRYGMFKQKIENGYQVETPDNWLKEGNPFELRREEYAKEVRFGGNIRVEYDDSTNRTKFVQENYESVLAIPYDMPIVGYGNHHVNTLRIWDAKAITDFQLDSFDRGDYHKAVEQENLAKTIVEVLYPNDNHYAGKELRLKQQYFFISASIQAAITKYKKTHDDIHKLPEKVIFQMNDTHPTVAVAELMRILLDEEELGWNEAWDITTKTCAYTNHTIMAEALEKWPIDLFSRLLPRVYQIIQEIDRRFLIQVRERYPGNEEKVRKMAILYNGQVRMAHLAIVAGFSVNGVARLHTEILKNQELRDFYEMMPEKFNNKTNGITQRRFLMHGNPLLADWVTEKIGTKDWITDLSLMSGLKKYADDSKALAEFMDIKYKNKVRLAEYIRKHNGIEVDPRSIFDVQVKRLHEYKRQLLNILHVMYLYNQIKEHPEMSFFPRTFIFGAKASAGYIRAKEIIKLINSVADIVNNDRSINGKLKVVFIEDYRVSNAEIIFAAADVSEQISTASKEASGTGNMKFMLNGAPTLGTMDGANVEIVEEVGMENAFIFGLSSEEVINYENNGGYHPQDIYNGDPDIRKVVDQLINGTYSNGDHEMYRDLYNSLLCPKDGSKADMYFILKDFRAYAEAQKKVEEAYKDKERWAKMALLNTACCGKFTSDRTIQEYVDDIWHLDKVTVEI
ncbi:glycogen/starch/alpha-glucan phosphorylase [Claveliimonas bilis]|uniref:glycogen/starch/alpha-glucan phosphorylase n=1 Tax=Claveliimonas bilis TaxID=3028070 RepID=UPI0029307DB2|nr:glycogen/starch/alpha-glucan phosphorylase [Claveliimonas bilis]BDZ80031.1 glycosyl transferase family 35 [Claveliimonas bilis]